jgi:hypothetical protein
VPASTAIANHLAGGRSSLGRSGAQARQGRLLRHDEVTDFRWMSAALRLTVAVETRLEDAFAAVEEGRASLGG